MALWHSAYIQGNGHTLIVIAYDKTKVRVAVESKVFGIGVESYTVGNNEFYQNYAATRGISCLLDNGHYHPTEVVSDKIPSLLAFYDQVALHVTRGVRWDSDHVVLLEDELKEICKEIVRTGATDKAAIPAQRAGKIFFMRVSPLLSERGASLL